MGHFTSNCASKHHNRNAKGMNHTNYPHSILFHPTKHGLREPTTEEQLKKTLIMEHFVYLGQLE